MQNPLWKWTVLGTVMTGMIFWGVWKAVAGTPKKTVVKTSPYASSASSKPAQPTSTRMAEAKPAPQKKSTVGSPAKKSNSGYKKPTAKKKATKKSTAGKTYKK
jgi:hypothetical protein